MARLRKSDNRCPACRLQVRVCVCASLPTLSTQTQIVLLMHQLEARKPTNTGRMALRCLPNSRYAVHGRDDDTVGAKRSSQDEAVRPRKPGDPQAAATGWLERATRPVLLYPAEDARPLSEFQRDGVSEPLLLIVPDATWSQAARMRKRIPGLAAVPCAHLPIDLVSEYRLRHDPRPGHLSTLQAIAVALGILEGPTAGPAIEAALLQIQRVMVDRTLWTKGRLAPGLVEGGLPATAVAPRSDRSSALVAPSDD